MASAFYASVPSLHTVQRLKNLVEQKSGGAGAAGACGYGWVSMTAMDMGCCEPQWPASAYISSHTGLRSFCTSWVQ